MNQNRSPNQRLDLHNSTSKQILKGVKVVGMGEATQGSREFFHVKHRLLEFLVT